MHVKVIPVCLVTKSIQHCMHMWQNIGAMAKLYDFPANSCLATDAGAVSGSPQYHYVRSDNPLYHYVQTNNPLHTNGNVNIRVS